MNENGFQGSREIKPKVGVFICFELVRYTHRPVGLIFGRCASNCGSGIEISKRPPVVSVRCKPSTRFC